MFPGWSRIVCITKNSTPECAPLLKCMSSSVSFYCENKSRCSCPFQMALCKAKHEGIPMLEQTFPINSDSCSGTGHPDASLPAVPWPAAGHLRLLCDSSAPAQEVCSQNGICISCVRTTGPSASSFNAFKNNSLLQSFPPHNICSKCSSFF